MPRCCQRNMHKTTTAASNTKRKTLSLFEEIYLNVFSKSLLYTHLFYCFHWPERCYEIESAFSCIRDSGQQRHLNVCSLLLFYNAKPYTIHQMERNCFLMMKSTFLWIENQFQILFYHFVVFSSKPNTQSKEFRCQNQGRKSLKLEYLWWSFDFEFQCAQLPSRSSHKNAPRTWFIGTAK